MTHVDDARSLQDFKREDVKRAKNYSTFNALTDQNERQTLLKELISNTGVVIPV